MSRLIQRLSVIAIWSLSAVLASVLVIRIWPGAHLLAGAREADDEWTWPKTLQVYPSHPGDPVRLIKIMKAGEEVVPGIYRIPQIAVHGGQEIDAVKNWLSDASFTLRSPASKTIVSVGISVTFPVRLTDMHCNTDTSTEAWCRAHTHWCDGGCPVLIQETLHWGLIPSMTASGVEARYTRARARGEEWRILRQGNGPLRLAPGEEITLSPADRVEGIWGGIDPRAGVPEIMSGIVSREGFEEAKNTEPCLERRRSKTGCAFAEAPKFNIGIDVVYFEDGTIWGNYGFGYALPDPDGIFTRVNAGDLPGIVSPAPRPN
ncbi:MAG: hypothetical protein ABSB82_07935 [Terriglobia bacterium]